MTLGEEVGDRNHSMRSSLVGNPPSIGRTPSGSLLATPDLQLESFAEQAETTTNWRSHISVSAQKHWTASLAFNRVAHV